MTPVRRKPSVLQAVEQNRGRLWAICYRMTGSKSDADDLSQEAIARAIERADQAQGADPTGWLIKLTARLCLDHLKRKKIERRVTALPDALEGPVLKNPEIAAVLREDLRFAVIVALQRLSPRQRAALILHDVCERSLAEVAELLGSNANAAKALLHRARAALAEARVHQDVDVPVDRRVVEALARAIEAGAIEQLAALLAEDVWGIVDRGAAARAARKPTYGRRAVSRQWSNAKRRLGVPVTAEVRVLNGEPALVIRLAGAPEMIVAVVHVETGDRKVVALRVNRDPERVPFRVPRSSFGA